jgi:hypothetical protein
LPASRFNKASDIARNVKALLNRENGDTRLKSRLKGKRREYSQLSKELRTATEREHLLLLKERKKTLQQEIFQLESEIRAAKQRVKGTPGDGSTPRADEPRTGALPDFVVIGGKKCGTTYLYHLLTRHPLVEPGAAKELHFFNVHFDEGVEWYRQCFPVPRWEDGRRTITGEATPEYLPHPLAPERMAKVIPQARLIALLRDPVDRTFSDYQQVVRKGREPRTFEEVMDYDNLGDAPRRFLSKSIYVDQLLRWSEFFPREQMLVLKSEDFFEDPAGTLQAAYGFLGLPEWEPEASEIKPKKRNKGDYEGGMDPATRERLEEYFEPHNRRLYDYLGRDFGW